MMRIEQIMRADVKRCASRDRLQDAARAMTQLGCDALPVCSPDGKLQGQLGANTIYKLVCVDGAPIQDLRVADAPVDGTCNCLPTTSVTDAHAMLMGTDADCLYVVDDRLRLIGIVGRKALTHVAGQQVKRIWWRETGTESRDENPYDGWTLIVSRKRLISPDGEAISIHRNLLRLLLVFMRSPGQTLTRNFLMKRVCCRDWSPTDRYIDVLIGQLRRKFFDDPVSQHVIRTTYGSGYAFLLEVERTPAAVRATTQPRPSQSVPRPEPAEASAFV
jgi:DNA-binding winged helix-turn-helix (wHTH) protein